MQFSQVRNLPDGVHLWVGSELVKHITPSWFDLNWWQAQKGELETAQGRGNTYFIDYDADGVKLSLVWRHYLRGGLPAKVSKDQYLWLGLDRTRPFQETFMTAELWERGLPVPKPVAGYVVKKGLQYRCDLITERLPNVATLADKLLAGETVPWSHIGETVARFHRERVDHTDLNIRNIMLNDEGQAYLIDFDGCFFRPKKGWRNKNLKRFRRSLDKLISQNPNLDVPAIEAGWVDFIEGYREKWKTSRAVGNNVTI